jgi:Putative metallopeptidase
MKNATTAAALACMLIWPATRAAQAQEWLDMQNPQLEISYVEPKNEAFRPIYEKLKRRKVLEELSAFMSPLSLTRKVPVKLDECGSPTTEYESGGGVIICYEYIAEIERLAPKEKTERGISRDTALTGAFVQSVLHNMSHMVFDVLQVPVWGREEDAADKLAGFIMLQFGPEVAQTLLAGTAHFFEASGRTWTGSDFSDVRSTESQRYYNYLCIAYGGPSSEAFTPFLQSLGFLRLQRSKRCSGEYRDLRWAFQKTILPHVDKEQMEKVQAMKILIPDDGDVRRRTPQ